MISGLHHVAILTADFDTAVAHFAALLEVEVPRVV
jgi:hypothetical protein